MYMLRIFALVSNNRCYNLYKTHRIMSIIVQKRKMVLHYKDEKPTVYALATVAQQKVPFEKLLDEVASSCGVSRSQSKAVVEALIDRMSMFIDYGMTVQMGDFGTFKPVVTFKAIDDKEKLSTNDVKRRKLMFRPGKRFKNVLNSISLQTDDDDDEEESGGKHNGGGTNNSGTNSGGGTNNGGGKDSGGGNNGGGGFD